MINDKPMRDDEIEEDVSVQRACFSSLKSLVHGNTVAPISVTNMKIFLIKLEHSDLDH
jgi:hypothetical protein